MIEDWQVLVGKGEHLEVDLEHTDRAHSPGGGQRLECSLDTWSMSLYPPFLQFRLHSCDRLNEDRQQVEGEKQQLHI